MTAACANVPLLLKTLAHIEAHPQEWDQERWICGTTACFAGRAAILDGAEFSSVHNAVFVIERAGDPPVHERGYIADAGTIHVADRAQHALRLTEYQADVVFAGCNTLDDLRAYVYRLAGDWTRLAETAEAAAVRSINGENAMPSAYADPDLDIDEKHLLWTDLKDALLRHQAAEAGDYDPVSLEPDWRDPETYANHCRGLVDDAINQLIGRRP